MSNRRNILFFFVAFIFLMSCKKSLNKDDYAAFVTNPENGFRKTQELGAFSISAMYEPTDYILSKELANGDLSSVEERRNELNEFAHFQFQIKHLKGGNILQHYESLERNESSRIHHFSFEAARDFILISGSDTLPCKLAHYSRNYNLTPTVDLSLTFNKPNKEDDLKLIYTDSQFDLGKVKFLFESENIQQAPELKL